MILSFSPQKNERTEEQARRFLSVRPFFWMKPQGRPVRYDR